MPVQLTPKTHDRGAVAARPAPAAVELFIAYGVFCSCAGWALSAIGRLDLAGYAAAAAVSVTLLVCIGSLNMRDAVTARRATLRIRARRFRRPLPAIYLIVAALATLGGALYEPNNYDMLTYRLPRVLHWLSAARWHWIDPTQIDRMNFSACGFEWSVAPLFLLTHGTRLFFLLNVAAYLLLPGMTFATLRMLGVSGGTAWVWMWLLPGGYVFVLQAASGANDTIAAVYLLASLYFAGRAYASRRFSDVALSVLSAALLSSNKASNLPLLLPCALAILPVLGLLRRRVAATMLLAALALSASFLPTAVHNYRYTGDWTGSPGDPGRLRLDHPVAGVVGNSIQLAVWNLTPPVFPAASMWNAHASGLLPDGVEALLRREFPRFNMNMHELQQEEGSGLGLAVTAMALIAAVASIVGLGQRTLRRDRSASPAGGVVRFPWAVSRMIVAAGLVAMLVMMATLGSEGMGRLAAPYYPLVLACCLLHPANERLHRRRWWRMCAAIAVASALPCLLFTPSRPLFPAQTILSRLVAQYPDSERFKKMLTVYRTYRHRADNLAPLRAHLPADATVVAFLASNNDSEVSLWRPWGSIGGPWAARRVTHVGFGETPESLRMRGVRYVVVGEEGLTNEQFHGTTLVRFLGAFGGRVIGHEKLTTIVQAGPRNWYVIAADQPGT